jgi:hypothetical protein
MYEIKGNQNIIQNQNRQQVQIVHIDESATESDEEDDIDGFVEDFLSDFHEDFLDFLLNELVQDALHETYENHLLDLIADEAEDDVRNNYH